MFRASVEAVLAITTTAVSSPREPEIRRLIVVEIARRVDDSLAEELPHLPPISPLGVIDSLVRRRGDAAASCKTPGIGDRHQVSREQEVIVRVKVFGRGVCCVVVGIRGHSMGTGSGIVHRKILWLIGTIVELMGQKARVIGEVDGVPSARDDTHRRPYGPEGTAARMVDGRCQEPQNDVVTRRIVHLAGGRTPDRERQAPRPCGNDVVAFRVR